MQVDFDLVEKKDEISLENRCIIYPFYSVHAYQQIGHPGNKVTAWHRGSAP